MPYRREHFAFGIRIRWDEIPSGTKLTKFVTVDDSQEDFKVTMHGFVTEFSKIYVTDQVVEPKNEKKNDQKA